MNKQILEALLMRYQANRAEAIVNLNTYLTAAVGVGEHPNVVDECDKLIGHIAAAEGKAETIQSMVKKQEEESNEETK